MSMVLSHVCVLFEQHVIKKYSDINRSTEIESLQTLQTVQNGHKISKCVQIKGGFTVCMLTSCPLFTTKADFVSHVCLSGCIGTVAFICWAMRTAVAAFILKIS